jgi:hypothetical protein
MNRRAEAFAVLDKRADADEITVPTAFVRSVLKRHYPVDIAGNSPWCHTCRHYSPCEDETAVIDALLGEEQ